MISKTPWLLWLAAALVATAAFDGSAAFAQKPTPTPTPTPYPHLRMPPTPGPDKIGIYIANDYDVDMNLGPLGNGHRNGIDEISGILSGQGGTYTGTVDASVDSNQRVAGGIGAGCAGHYSGVQKLKVIAHFVDGFSNLIQQVNWSQSTGSPSSGYLMLEFTPSTKPPFQPTNFNAVTNQLTVDCHDLIIPQGDDDVDDSAYATRPPGFDPSRFEGIAFLPLNDTRWTTKGQGYIIRLPTSGLLKYKDIQPPGNVGLFKLNKSVWSVQIARSP
jgi:hypothetical protein